MTEETSVQLITLNTGDHIISEARKVYVDKEEQTSIYVELTDPQILSLEKDVGGGHYEIKLTKWNPFSSISCRSQVSPAFIRGVTSGFDFFL